MKSCRVAVLGATGEVGRVMLEILQQRRFPVSELFLLASERSAGTEVEFGDRKLRVMLAEDFDFADADIGLFSAGGGISDRFAPRAAENNCIVVDNTSRFRLEPDIPLVVPEVNAARIADYKNRNIVANPNCSTIQMVVALKPLYDAVGISRIDVCTYQAVSGAGSRAVEELASQSRDLLNGYGEDISGEVFPRRIAFNTIPAIGGFATDGYSEEELKMVNETRKILEDDSIEVCPTCVRVPVFYGHSEALHIRTQEPLDSARARKLLAAAPGVIVQDDLGAGDYPTPAFEGNCQDPVYVGRIRDDLSDPRRLSLWVVADNIRKGAALNSVEIAETLLNQYL